MKNQAVNKQKICSERLLARRNACGLTQAQVAAQAGITLSTYKGYELGIRTPIRPAVVILAHVLGTSASFLYGETDDPSADLVMYPVANHRIPELVTAYENASEKDRNVVDTVLGLRHV